MWKAINQTPNLIKLTSGNKALYLLYSLCLIFLSLKASLGNDFNFVPKNACST